jgi:UDP-N-acetyl-D-mannosaminuronic acid transferase (WecB/TagA/CpsF family)
MDIRPNGAAVSVEVPRQPHQFRQILGAKFYIGDMPGLLALSRAGGLVVVPAAPALATLPKDAAYRVALEESDFAITDSGFMVLLWLLYKRERLERISGLRYLSALLREMDFLQASATFWVVPSEDDLEAYYVYLRERGAAVERDDFYVAPKYSGGGLVDENLLERVEAQRPRFVIINLGGGVQERLGYYLRGALAYRPMIVCTGAAIAFLSRRQSNIPPWADRLMLGWLMRILNDPLRFIPRYWKAMKLALLLWRHGSESVVRRSG